MSAVDKSALIYNLMYKDIEVAEFSFVDAKLVQIRIINKRYVPLGCYKENHLKTWWEKRSVPKTRKGIKNVLDAYNVPDTESLVLTNLGLSLTDCYWVKPLGSVLTWDSVNYYNNNFSDIMTDIALYADNITQFNAKTKFLPSTTTNGEVPKKWIILPDGLRVLVKGTHGNKYQQSYNETFATLVNSRQHGVPYVIYELQDLHCMSGKGLGCRCANLCNENYEIFSAWSVLRNYRYLKNMGYYMSLKYLAINQLGLTEAYV